jgi:hypothetical protein
MRLLGTPVHWSGPLRANAVLHNVKRAAQTTCFLFWLPARLKEEWKLWLWNDKKRKERTGFQLSLE